MRHHQRGGLRSRLAAPLALLVLALAGFGALAYRTDIVLGLGDAMMIAATAVLVVGGVALAAIDHWLLAPIRDLLRVTDRAADAFAAAAPPPHHSLAAAPEIAELARRDAESKARLRDLHRRIDHLIHHDSLTDLPNRVLFRTRLSAAIADAGRAGSLVGVLFIDLDRFKQVNDSYGHNTGDQLLRQIARRLRAVFRQDDLVARFGGDEFAVLLEHLHQRDEMSRLAEKAIAAIERPFRVDGKLFHSGASIGIAVAPDDSIDVDELIQQADAAMYAAKHGEGSSYRYVSDELTQTAAARHTMENDLRAAVREHELELHFQPVRALADGRLHCYESLLRWPHAAQGMLSPTTFMDAMADAGLCTQVSDWVLDRLQVDRPAPDAKVSVNLSARLLHDTEFTQRLFDRLDNGRLDASQLIIEITEDSLETDLRAASRVLQALKQRGVRIALDDFGTGQASLSHLRRFPFDYVKIDRSFVAGIGTDATEERLLQAIIHLAHAMDMAVVAEGVESESQRDFLAAEGCDFIQGYLVGRPTPATATAAG